MPDIIITPSTGKLEFVDNSSQNIRKHAFSMDDDDGIKIDAPFRASSVRAPLNIINVNVDNSNTNYPFVLASGSAETGIKTLMMDGSGGTYNPFTNTATIDISGNSATTTLASNSTNLGGVAAASYVTLTGTQTLTNKTITGTFTGNLTGTGSWATNAVNANTATNSTQLNGQSDSYYTNIPARLGYTPVNKAGDTVTGNLIINGNFTVNGATTLFSASNVYISSSQLYIEDNILTLNAFSPYLRYAGVEMYDSGSGTLSSLLWDGEADYFFLSGSSVNGKIITGPDGQTNLSSNFVPKATAGNKLGNSLIYDNGTNVGIGTTTVNQKLSIYPGTTGGISLQDIDGETRSHFFIDNTNPTYSTGIRTQNYYLDFDSSGASQNAIRFYTGTNAIGTGTERMRIISTGNVGIGTTNPAYKLEVYSGAKTSAFTGLSISNFNNYDGTAASLVTSQLRFAILENDTGTYNAPARTFAILESGNEVNNSSSDGFFAISTRFNAVVAQKFRITAAGNVGIGTTSPTALLELSSSTAASLLNVKGAGGNGILFVSGSGAVGIGTTSLTDGARLTILGETRIASSAAYFTHLNYLNGGNNIISSANGGSTVFRGSSNNITAMTILGSGLVGIGTSSPSYKLHVNGGPTEVGGQVVAAFEKQSSTDGKIATFVNTTGSGYTSYIYIGSNPGRDWKIGKNVLNSGTTGHFQITNDLNQLRMQISAADDSITFPSSSVGIGTTSPAYKLDVGASGGDVISVRLTPGYERVRFHTFDLLGYNDGNLWMIGNNPTNTLVLGKTWDWDNQIGIAYTPGTVGNSGGILQIGQISKNNANYTHGITRLYTNGLERITIIANGNVGISTTLPTTPLHVVGVISGSSFSGAGTGLTGTAANLTAGTATNATQLGGIAAASYVTLTGTETLTNKTITGTFTGNLTGNASTSTRVNGTNGQLLFKDIRAIAPNNIEAGYLQFGFTTWTNTLSTTPYADYLHLRSYTDSSGGNDNLVMFRKDAIGMRIWQQTFGSASNYSTYKDVAFTDQIGNGTITIAAGTGVGVGTTNTFTTNQSGATTVTISNTGVTSAVAGTGVGVSGATGAVTFSIGQAVGTGNSPTFAGASLNGNTTVTGQLQVNNTTPTAILRLYSGGSTAWNVGVGDSSGTYFNISADFGSILINKSTGNIWISGSGINNTVLHSTSTLTAGNLSGTIPSGVLGNSTVYIGSTAIALNRGSASQTLTGVSIDGNAATVTNGIYTSSIIYIGTTAITMSRSSASQTLTGISIDGNAATATTATTANALNTSNSYTVASLTATTEVGTRGSNIGVNLERGDSTIATLRFDADNFRIWGGGTGGIGEILRVTETGNVGIGTTTGTFTLNVYNNADVWHARFGSATGEVRIGGQTSSGAVIQSFVPGSGTVRDLYIQRDGGNVGIGTSNATAKLESYFASNALTINYLATNLNGNSPIPTYGFSVTDGSAETRSIKAGIGYERHETNGRGTLHFYNRTTNDTASISGNRSSAGDIKMSLNNNGNVGIGTTGPSARLHVFDTNNSPATGNLLVTSTGGNASIRIDSNSTSNYTYFTLSQGGVGKFELGIVPTTSDFYINPTVQSGANGAAIYIKKADGNVGIGSTSPGYKLDVVGDINFSSTLKLGGVDVISNSSSDVYINGRVIRNASTSTQDGMYIGYNSGGTTNAHIRFYANAGNERMRIQANDGNVGIGTTSAGKKLDVEGIVRTRGASGTGGFEIGAATTGAAKWRIEWDSASDSLDFNWVG